MTCIQRIILAACWALVFTGQAHAAAPPARGPALGAQAPMAQIGADYRLKSGDQLSIEVFGAPEFDVTIDVADDGTVRVPLAGPVAVGGQSPTDAARKIEVALKSGEFLINPQVTVTVVQSMSQRISVLGEVTSPGRYPIESKSTVLDIIALAGGITAKGSDVVYILRADASGAMQRLPVNLRLVAAQGSGNAAATMTLRPGDTIEVPKGTFFITGQVTEPGEYRIEGDMMLFEAIARAGGVTQLGSSSRVEIRRRGPDDKVVEVKVNKSLRIQPGDVIRVKERLF